MSAGIVLFGLIANGVLDQAKCQAQWGSPQQNPVGAASSATMGREARLQTDAQQVARPIAQSYQPNNYPQAPAAGVNRTAPKIEPIYWGSHGLAIPYRWAGQVGNRGAKEVVLYVSQDVSLGAGATWQKVSSAAPQVHSFQYQAPGDGEYFFAIRTYDRFGAYQPVGPLEPEMHVIVDTTSPRNPQVTAEVNNGILVAKVVLNDSSEIDPQSLRIYVQAPNQPSWTPVQIEPLNEGPLSADQLAAVARWRLPIGASQAAIRVSVSDKAGNRSETNANAMAKNSFARSTTESHFTSNRYALAAPALSNPAYNSMENLPQSAVPSQQDPFAVANQQHGLREPLASQQTSPDWNDNSWNQASQTSSMSQPSSPSQPWPVDSAQTQPFLAQSQPTRTLSNRSNPFQSASFRSLQERTQKNPSSSSEGGALRRSVNSTSFEFDYELDKTGKWGVANVELWGTTDDGNSWRRFAIDSDRLSPIHVNVPGEGDYGFKILVESVGGFEPTPPRPGEKPEVMVRVDQTAPRVMIQRAEQGQGYQADRLSIQWSAIEEFPAERPIDLFYSDRPSGPWVPLATSLDNSGRYAWRIQRHLPAQVYLKIEARDEAGNVGSGVTPNAISISVPQTTGSLRGIRTAPGYGY